MMNFSLRLSEGGFKCTLTRCYTGLQTERGKNKLIVDHERKLPVGVSLQGELIPGKWVK